MNENRLIDTNVLVYAYDISEKAKRRIARSTENERDFRKIPGITVVNPFKTRR